jgi:hypothetical protein
MKPPNQVRGIGPVKSGNSKATYRLRVMKTQNHIHTCVCDERTNFLKADENKTILSLFGSDAVCPRILQ